MAVSAACLAAAASAHADPTVLLSGFGAFSGTETQITFEGLNLLDGGDVGSVDGVDFSLTSGGPAKYFAEPFPRESGLPGTGSINNFWDLVPPYPDLDLLLPGPMQRVAFEARVNAEDEVAVTLLAQGAVVDRVVVPGRGADALYFYGFENAAGFDEMVVDAVDHASGAFSLDNLTFDPLDQGDPTHPDPGGPLAVSCSGFGSLPRMRSGHQPPLRPLLARLTGPAGEALGSGDLTFPPMLHVTFVPAAGGQAIDVTDDVVQGTGHFSFLPRRQRWIVWLLPSRMRSPGTYMATMESGDENAYTIDPTCADWTVNPAPPAKPRDPHGRGDCGGYHDRDGVRP